MERLANEVYVDFGSKLGALLEERSKHSLDLVFKVLKTLVLLLSSILGDPENEEKRAIKPESKSLANLFEVLGRPYLMGLLKGETKVVLFRESIYFGLRDLPKLAKLLDLATRYKDQADALLKERGELRNVWRHKKEKQDQEFFKLKLQFYDDRDLRDLKTSKMGGGGSTALLQTLAKEKLERDRVFPKATPKPNPKKTIKPKTQRVNKRFHHQGAIEPAEPEERPRTRRSARLQKVPKVSDF